ncbi:MAG: DNA-directed RNA polymerase subunit omega [Terriglobus sp.]
MNDSSHALNGHDALLNKYSLVKGAARRARQLQSGAAPLVPTNSMKACRVAQDEIRSGTVRYFVTPSPKAILPSAL